MANVPFSTLHDQILPYLPGAEVPIVNLQIRKVVREFMKRTTLIRESFEFALSPGFSAYRLTPAFGQVSSVLSVKHVEDEHIMPSLPEESRSPVPQSGRPSAWFTAIPDIVTLYPNPDVVYNISVQAVLTLTQTDVVLPEELVAHNSEAIAAGVLATMMGMPGKPWTQTQTAKENGRVFAGVIKTIRGNLRDGGQPNQSTFRAARKFGV